MAPKCTVAFVLQLTDLTVGDSCCQADSAHQENVLQQSDEDGDWLVRLHLCRGTQHSHVGVSGTMTTGCLYLVYSCVSVSMVLSVLQ